MEVMDEMQEFDFETKVRKLVLEILKPTVTRIAEEKKSIEQIKDQYDLHKNRIIDLEYYSHKFSKRIDEMDHMKAAINTMEAKVLQIATESTAYGQGMQIKMEYIEEDNSQFKDTTAALQRQVETLQKEIKECTGTVGEYKELLNRDTEKLEEFNKINNDIMDLQMHLDEVEKQALSTHNAMLASQNAFGDLEARLEVRLQQKQRLFNHVENNMNDKLDEDIFLNYKQNTDKAIRLLNNQTSNIENAAKKHKRKLTKRLPTQIQLKISENMYKALDGKQKKRFAKFEAPILDLILQKAPKNLEQALRRARERTQQAIDKPTPVPQSNSRLSARPGGNKSPGGHKSSSNTPTQEPKLLTHSPAVLPTQNLLKSLFVPPKTKSMIMEEGNLNGSNSEGEIQIEQIMSDSEHSSDRRRPSRTVIKKVAYNSPDQDSMTNLVKAVKKGAFKQLILESIDTAFYTDDEGDYNSPSEEEIEIIDYGPDIDDIRSELKSFKEEIVQKITEVDRRHAPGHERVEEVNGRVTEVLGLLTSFIQDTEIDNKAFKQQLSKTHREFVSISNECKKRISEFDQQTTDLAKQSNKNYLAIQKLIDFWNLSLSSSYAEDIDKQNISLYGAKENPVKLNNTYMDPTSKKAVSSAFKMAWLSYKPGNVMHNNKAYKRGEILGLQQRSLQEIKLLNTESKANQTFDNKIKTPRLDQTFDAAIKTPLIHKTFDMAIKTPRIDQTFDMSIKIQKQQNFERTIRTPRLGQTKLQKSNPLMRRIQISP